MQPEEAHEAKKYIFEQLDSFDSCVLFVSSWNLNNPLSSVLLFLSNAFANCASTPRLITTALENTCVLLNDRRSSPLPAMRSHRSQHNKKKTLSDEVRLCSDQRVNRHLQHLCSRLYLSYIKTLDARNRLVPRPRR